MASEISKVSLQQQYQTHTKWMALSGAVMVAAFVGCMILGAYAIQDHMEVGNLNDDLRWFQFLNDQYAPWGHWHSEVSHLQTQIAEVSQVGYTNLGFSITLLAITLLGLGSFAHRYSKRKEVQEILAPPAQKGPQTELSGPEQAALHEKKMKIAGVVAVISTIMFIVLIALAINTHFKINDLWDQRHAWKEAYISSDTVTRELGDKLLKEIVESTSEGWNEFGFSMGFLAIALASIAYAVHHRGKMKGQKVITKPQADDNL